MQILFGWLEATNFMFPGWIFNFEISSVNSLCQIFSFPEARKDRNLSQKKNKISLKLIGERSAAKNHQKQLSDSLRSFAARV